MAWLFVILCKIFILLQGVTVSLQKDREFVLDNKNLYYDCEKMPPGFVTEDKFIDRSKMTFVKDDNGAIHISGNGTVVWDIQSTDRVELDLAAFKQERGKWKPTPYKTTIKDFCKFLYEKNQPHYSYSIAHVTNKDYTKERCLTPGTVYEFEPYVMKMVVGVSPVGPGHYKGVVHISAFDSNGEKRPNQFCLETTGNLS